MKQALLGVSWFLSGCAASTVEEPPIAQKAYVEEFVQAFNTGSPDTLAVVIEWIFSPEFLEANGGPLAEANDRIELFRTYGELEMQHVETTVQPPIVWAKGRISNAWVGYQFELNEAEPPLVAKVITWRARPVPYPEHELSQEQIVDSMQMFLRTLHDAGLFSGSVTMSHDGEIVLDESWGSDGQEPPAPFDGDTRISIASVTKLFTATALLQLAEAGKVHLDDTLGKYIPEYPMPFRDKVTLRHLITHTSGIELDDDPVFIEAVRNAQSIDDLLQDQLRALEGRELAFEPGTEYDYTS